MVIPQKETQITKVVYYSGHTLTLNVDLPNGLFTKHILFTARNLEPVEYISYSFIGLERIKMIF